MVSVRLAALADLSTYSEVNHGAAAAPDGSRYYISNEAESTLDVVDGKTYKVIKHIPLSEHPNNIGISKDGGRVVVCIRNDPGMLDVVDTVARVSECAHVAASELP